MLGIFPAFSAGPGGVQESGRLAWQAIVRRGSLAPRTESEGSVLFCYGRGDAAPATGNLGLGEESRASKRSPLLASHEDPTAISRVVHATTKLGAVMAALRSRWTGGLVLIWHLGLLKLLPFFRIHDAKVVLFLHGIEAWSPQDWLTSSLLRRVDLFLCNSNHTWSRFLSVNPRFRTAPHRIIPLGVDVPIDRRVPDPDAPPAVLMIGRLLRTEGYKGHREMILAWPLVLEQLPEAQLWIAGDGDLRSELEGLAGTLVSRGSVRFLGLVSWERKEELLLRSRCLAMPSRKEGFGLAYLEAMRAGRPCLVSTCDAGQEVVNPPEAGLAADPGNPQGLAEAVCRLLTPSPEWKALSRQARIRYETLYTATHFQNRLLSALEIAGS